MKREEEEKGAKLRLSYLFPFVFPPSFLLLLSILSGEAKGPFAPKDQENSSARTWYISDSLLISFRVYYISYGCDSFSFLGPQIMGRNSRFLEQGHLRICLMDSR